MDPPDAGAADDLARLSDTRNLYNSLDWELAWKNYMLRTHHWYLEALATNGDGCLRICGAYMVEFARSFHELHGRRPVILDVGCGPISSLAYLVHEGLAEVVGVDTIADEYAELLSRYGYASPLRQVRCAGEQLDRAHFDEAFDVVFCRNALDHNMCPSLTWLNMFRLLPVGGHMIQSHSIREATKEGWKQLHQWDLYPDEAGQLFIQDRQGVSFSLTDGLALELEQSQENNNAGQSGWATSRYRKSGDSLSPGILANVLVQLQRVFLERSSWALQLERAVFEATATEHPQRAPLDLRIDDSDLSCAREQWCA